MCKTSRQFFSKQVCSSWQERIILNWAETTIPTGNKRCRKTIIRLSILLPLTNIYFEGTLFLPLRRARRNINLNGYTDWYFNMTKWRSSSFNGLKFYKRLEFNKTTKTIIIIITTTTTTTTISPHASLSTTLWRR